MGGQNLITRYKYSKKIATDSDRLTQDATLWLRLGRAVSFPPLQILGMLAVDAYTGTRTRSQSAWSEGDARERLECWNGNREARYAEQKQIVQSKGLFELTKGSFATHRAMVGFKKNLQPTAGNMHKLTSMMPLFD